jgi:hypothetical protein
MSPLDSELMRVIHDMDDRSKKIALQGAIIILKAQHYEELDESVKMSW